MKKRKITKFLFRSALISIFIYFAIAIGLILSQPLKTLDGSNTLSFPQTSAVANQDNFQATYYTARDGTKLNLRRYPSQSDKTPLVILIHGSGWHGGGYTSLAEFLSDTGQFDILLPDLRGHGPETKTRGDVAYIGQLEDDLADLIKTFKSGNQKVFMIGHSSGGGLVTRFAGGEHGYMLNKAVLMAPYLKYNAPTMREKSGGWAHPLTRRIIGLSMLNTVGITWFNDMTVIQFNYPLSLLEGPSGPSATQSYSYRLNTSFAPRMAYLEDITALPNFLLIVGADDDAFIATNFEKTMSAATNKGKYQIVQDVDHLGLINNDTAKTSILEYLSE
ncbi:MAG: alpha/beta hydrolase [Proteobacteria bacterium]|nr:alpha/beta hydrolase [Pseudomonadota bacterium]